MAAGAWLGKDVQEAARGLGWADDRRREPPMKTVALTGFTDGLCVWIVDLLGEPQAEAASWC